jgi:hypothetical protein
VTDAAIIAGTSLFKENHVMETPITLLRENKGNQQKCDTLSLQQMWHHRSANIDLFLEYHQAAKI